MKVKNANAAALIAALAPAALAADLDTNLVVNGDFETNTGTALTGFFGAVLLNDGAWQGIGRTLDRGDGPIDVGLLAYPYSTDYAASPYPPGNLFGDPIDAGQPSSYFYAGTYENTGPNDANGDGEITPDEEDLITFQSIDVSTGDAAAAIATGSAFYDFRAFFTSYFTQTDVSYIRLVFLDSTGNAIPGTSPELGGPDFLLPLGTFVDNDGINDDTAGVFADGFGRRPWAEDRTAGLIPANTATISIGIFANQGAGGAFDGYIDNVQLAVSTTPPAILPGPFGISSFSNGQIVSDLDAEFPFDITWTEATNADTYTLEILNRNNDTVVFSVTTASDTFSATVTKDDIPANDIYAVRVTATNSSGETVTASELLAASVGAAGGTDFDGSGVLDSGDVINFLDQFQQDFDNQQGN